MTGNPDAQPVIAEIDLRPHGSGTIQYNKSGLWIDPSAPGFNEYRTAITDEEAGREPSAEFYSSVRGTSMEIRSHEDLPRRTTLYGC